MDKEHLAAQIVAALEQGRIADAREAAEELWARLHYEELLEEELLSRWAEEHEAKREQARKEG